MMQDSSGTEPIATPPSVEAVQAQAFVKQEPAGIRIPLKSLYGLVLFFVLSAMLWALFISPTEYGTALEVGTRVATGMSKKAGVAPPYAKVDVEPMRHTRGSVWANDIAQALSSSKSSSKDDHMSGMLANSHGPEVAMAIQRGSSGMQQDCSVQISAQAFDHIGTPYAPLLTRVGAREDSFLLLLTHEMAHCYWNPGPAYETRVNAKGNHPNTTMEMIKLMPLVTNISESYADAYSMIFAARFDRKYYDKAYQGLVAFRSSKGVPNDVYNTLNAISAAVEIAPTLPGNDNPLSVRWDVTQRYVLSAALTGGMRWLVAQGMSQEDAIKRVAFVIDGQGIEFSLKNVQGKDYLIVTKAPEGFVPAAGMDPRDPGQRPTQWDAVANPLTQSGSIDSKRQ
jgi:hypothetical protein